MKKKTVHIHVKNQLGISGSFPWEQGSVPTDGTLYKIKEKTFPMKPVSMVASGSENQETLSGIFAISGVGDDYGNVTFDGIFVFESGKGQGSANWDGNHAPRTAGGSDPWTSDTTTPIPHSSHSQAKSGTP